MQIRMYQVYVYSILHFSIYTEPVNLTIRDIHVYIYILYLHTNINSTLYMQNTTMERTKTIYPHIHSVRICLTRGIAYCVYIYSYKTQIYNCGQRSCILTISPRGVMISRASETKKKILQIPIYNKPATRLAARGKKK